jgi:hypothetical protein
MCQIMPNRSPEHVRMYTFIGVCTCVCVHVHTNLCAKSCRHRSAEHMRMYTFIGALMGACLRSNSPLELDLASLVWKPLVGEVCTVNDILAIDEPFARDINAMRDTNTADAWARKPRTWTLRSVSGRLASLRPNGAHVPVEYADRDEYMAACVAWRLSECSEQVRSCVCVCVCVRVCMRV